MTFQSKIVFDAVRKMLGRGFTPAEVRALDQALAEASGVPAKPFALTNPAGFFASVRAKLGSLSQTQVNGFNSLLDEMGIARWPLAWTAYGLATAWWETAKAMQPVEEAYYLGDKAAAYRKTLRYYPWHGRGYPQLTWEKNYRWADEECGLGGSLLADPDLAMRPDIAGQIMIKGMEQGAFTGKRLADYLPLDGRAGFSAYQAARRIINGTDKAAEIARVAQIFEAALEAGGWS